MLPCLAELSYSGVDLKFHFLFCFFPPRRDHVLVNKGVGATSSGIFSACIEHMLPQVSFLYAVIAASFGCDPVVLSQCVGGCVHKATAFGACVRPGAHRASSFRSGMHMLLLLPSISELGRDKQ